VNFHFVYLQIELQYRLYLKCLRISNCERVILGGNVRYIFLHFLVYNNIFFFYSNNHHNSSDDDDAKTILKMTKDELLKLNILE